MKLSALTTLPATLAGIGIQPVASRLKKAASPPPEEGSGMIVDADEEEDHGFVRQDPVPPSTINRMVGEYKPSLAMRIAIERAHRDQPPMIMLSSNVRPDPKNMDWKE